jgi:hypothetical protein
MPNVITGANASAAKTMQLARYREFAEFFPRMRMRRLQTIPPAIPCQMK